jgi:hypothetical protein
LSSLQELVAESTGIGSDQQVFVRQTQGRDGDGVEVILYADYLEDSISNPVARAVFDVHVSDGTIRATLEGREYSLNTEPFLAALMARFRESAQRAERIMPAEVFVDEILVE